MVIEEEREEDFERAFEELYMETICIAKKNKELIKQLKAINNENDIFKGELKSKEEDHTQSKAKVKELQQQRSIKNKELKKQLKVIINKKDVLNGELRSKAEDLTQSKATVKELQQ